MSVFYVGINTLVEEGWAKVHLGDQAKGERMIDKALGGEGWNAIMDEIRAGNGGVVGLVIQWLEKIVNAITDLRSAMPFGG